MFDFPNTPTSGQVVNGPNGATWQWDGTKWLANALWQGATVIVSDTAPANPPAGALWWDSVGGQLYLNYHDPNSTEWVIANTGGIPDAPTDNNIYARQSQLWVSITPSIAASPNNVGRNFIQNSQFNVLQRGTGSWTGGYTADRWQFFINGDTSTCSIAALNDANRAQIGDESAVYALYFTVNGTATAANYTEFCQKIEKARRLSGKTVTVSFWAVAGTAGLQVGVRIAQNFGTGGSPSAQTGTPAQTVTLTAVPARYSLTFAIPSTSGMTFGTNGDDTTVLWLALSSGSTNSAALGVGVQTGTCWFYGVQLEIGSGAGFPTPLAKRDPADDLALCQRFYQIGNMELDAYASAASAVIGGDHQFPVQMRAGPTMTLTLVSQTNCTASVTGATQNYGAYIYHGYLTSTASGQCYYSGNWTASADL